MPLLQDCPFRAYCPCSRIVLMGEICGRSEARNDTKVCSSELAEQAFGKRPWHPAEEQFALLLAWRASGLLHGGELV